MVKVLPRCVFPRRPGAKRRNRARFERPWAGNRRQVSVNAHTADDLCRPPAAIEIVLRGSVAVVRGVVEHVETRDSILRAVASLHSITDVEDELRSPPA